MATRAERRAERERLKRKRARGIPWAQDAAKTGDLRRVGMSVDTPKLCSCEMCGNPRRYFRDRTIQERRYGWT